MIFKIKPHPELNEEVAEKILANVFDACAIPPNTIPLDKLSAYSEYRRERYSLQRVILIIIMLIFCIIPLCFISPSFTIEKISSMDTNFPTYEIKLSDSIVPVSVVTATLDERSIPVYETGSRTYSVTPTDNGLMSIYVRLGNKQYISSSQLECGDIVVSGVDTTAPRLDPERKYTRSQDGTSLLLYLIEDGSGLDYDRSYGESDSGNTISHCIISESDPSENLMVFEFPSESTNYFIYDNKGNVLQLVLTR